MFSYSQRASGPVFISALLLFASQSLLAATSLNGFILDEALIPVEEILPGGPPRDGIPALDQPKFIAASAAKFLNPRDRVLGIVVDGVSRAYPIKILNYHEIVNDRIGEQPIVVSFCPLCGSGMIFSAELTDRVFNFGVSGLLYNSDVLLYDRQTESLWSQIKSLAVTGPMKGTQLTALAVSHTTWRDWLSRHPETDVLSDDTGFRRQYQINPYPTYKTDRQLYFPVAVENRDYPRKSMVLGLQIDDQFKAYPFKELKKSPPKFRDELNGKAYTVVFDKKNQAARIIGLDGEEIPSLTAFWFAWYAFHPDTEIYKFKKEK